MGATSGPTSAPFNAGALAAGLAAATLDLTGGKTHATPRTVAAKLAEFPTLKDFSGVADAVQNVSTKAWTGTDNGPALQSAIDDLSAAGGGILYIDGAKYGIGTSVSPKAGVTVFGAGMGITQLIQLTATVGLFYNPTSDARRNYFGLVNLSLIGQWEATNSLSGSNGDRATSLSNIDYLLMEKVEANYWRQMSLTAQYCTEVHIQECRVLHSARDGVNIAGSSRTFVVDNFFQWGNDDAISIDTNTAIGNLPNADHTVRGNTIIDFYGIKMLGATRATITGNRAYRVKGYFLFTGGALGTLEGINDMLGLLVSGNLVNDVLLASLVGGGAGVQYGMMIATYATSVTAPIVAGSPPTITKPESLSFASNNTGNNRAGAQGILITGNEIKQTLPNSVNYSDWGFGQVFKATGFADVAIGTSHMRSGTGIVLGGPLLGLDAKTNQIEGFNKAFDLLDTIPEMAGRSPLVISHNSCRRIGQFGISSQFSTAKNIPCIAEGNLFDLDPYFESDRRTNAGANVDGTWQGSSTYPVALYTVKWQGVVIRHNTFKNLYRECNADANTIQYLERNTYIGEFITARGIGVVDTGQGHWSTMVWEGSDPSNSNQIGKALSKGGLFVTSAAAPVSGLYAVNTLVWRANIATAAPPYYACTQSGGASSGARTNAVLTANNWYTGANSKVYQLISNNSGATSANEPVGTVLGAQETLADGYVWQLQAIQAAIFKASGNLA